MKFKRNHLNSTPYVSYTWSLYLDTDINTIKCNSSLKQNLDWIKLNGALIGKGFHKWIPGLVQQDKTAILDILVFIY